MKDIICPYCSLKFTPPISLHLFMDHLSNEHGISIGKRGMVSMKGKIIPKKERESLLKIIRNIKRNNSVKLDKITRSYKKVKKPKIRIISTAFESSRRWIEPKSQIIDYARFPNLFKVLKPHWRMFRLLLFKNSLIPIYLVRGLIERNIFQWLIF